MASLCESLFRGVFKLRLPGAPRAGRVAVIGAAAIALHWVGKATAAEPPTRAPQPRHALGKPFACADYGGNKVCLVDAAGRITWQIPAHRPQDVWVLRSGNILFSHLRGAREVTRDKKVVGEVFDFKQLGTISGVFLLGAEGDPADFEVLR